jgi:HEPN domain-containing protein
MPARRIPRGGTRGTVYREVARLRCQDALSLLNSQRYNGSVYLAGYAIECQLKFAICRRKGKVYLPANLEVHDWDKLVAAAGLLPEIKAQRVMAALYFALTDSWGPTIRYRTSLYPANQAKQLFNEMNQLYAFLNELVP